MSKIPRASLCITLLTDEDFGLLMATRGGAEAFGVFVALVVAGRERLQRGKARQLSESDALVFEGLTSHVISIARVTAKQFDGCLSMLAGVAATTNSEPWLYLDESSHLVIRSFFKFNTSTGWGGQRPGAGRHSSANQDDSSGIQDDSNLHSSWSPSGSGSGTGIKKPPLSPSPKRGSRGRANPTMTDAMRAKLEELCREDETECEAVDRPVPGTSPVAF